MRMYEYPQIKVKGPHLSPAPVDHYHNNRHANQKLHFARQPYCQASYSYLTVSTDLGDIETPTPSQCRHHEAPHPAFKATHKVNTSSLSLPINHFHPFLKNARPLHPPPRHSFQIPLPLHPRPLNRSRLRHPSSRRCPFDNCSKRALLRSLWLAYIPLLHSIESVFAEHQG